MEYQNYNNIMNNLGYGNVISNDNYITGNFIYQNKNHQNAEALQTNDVREDHVFLDNLLDQFDGEKRKEIIEDLISDRVSLNKKMKSEIENIKDHLRSMKSLSAYQINPVMPFKDIARLYSTFNHKEVEEEIKAWKDISFLQLKLFDEGLAGSSNYDSNLTGGINYEKKSV